MSTTDMLNDTIIEGLKGGGYVPPAIGRAILERFVVIPRSELPAIIVSGSGFDVNNVWFPPNNAEHFERHARRMLALAEYMSQDESAIEAGRDARRNELAVELAEGMKSYGEEFAYTGLSTVAKRAIDRIIELEAQAQA